MTKAYGLRKLGVGALVGVTAAVGLATAALADGMPGGSVGDCCGFSWRGFYIGGHVGFSNVEVDRTIVNSPFWATGPGGSGILDQDMNGRLIFGGQIGYNFAAGPWVFGVEATLAELNRENVRSPFFTSDYWRAEINTLTTVTGRLGYAFDKVLVYAKGGYAGADAASHVHNGVTNIGLCGPATGTFCHAGDSEWHNGWTVGTGIEFSVHKNVIVGFEYSYIDLGSERSVTPPSAIFLDQSVDVQIHSFTGRVSYKFN